MSVSVAINQLVVGYARDYDHVVRLKGSDTINVFTEKNEYVKLPAGDSAVIIMVGPSTGVVPFRAFVEERTEWGASGRNWFFFRNPHLETDFLYQTEWLNHLKCGSLDRLDVAFSRDQQDKIYVQHRLVACQVLVDGLGQIIFWTDEA